MRIKSKNTTTANGDGKTPETNTSEQKKRLSAFGKGMIKYAGTVQIIDMRAVMR